MSAVKASAPPARSADACANCTAWCAPPPLSAAELERVERAGFGERKGRCLLMPTPVLKAADEWCRQHERRAP